MLIYFPSEISVQANVKMNISHADFLGSQLPPSSEIGVVQSCYFYKFCLIKISKNLKAPVPL